MKTFTLNNGNVYTQQDNGYCFATIDGKKIRCSAASFKMAHEQFVKEENERQNAANEFINIEALVEEAEEERTTEELKEIQDLYCRHPEGSDLEVPAVINEFGCVDCSKCNVQNCVHRDCMRRNPTNKGGLAECHRLKVKAEEPKQPKAKKVRKSKDAFHTSIAVPGLTLTAKQTSFLLHLSDTNFWENGLDSCIWVDILCDEIGGEFAGKPMTVGAMISTLCEKGLGTRGKDRVNGHKCTSFALTELGKKVAAEVGLQ